MPEISLENNRIHYEKKGTGLPIVLMHGYGMDSSIWENYLAPLQQYQILLIDMPGFGGSSIIEKYDLYLIARQVKAVLDAENIDRCIFFGHSMGGYVALHFLELFENNLLGLGLVHSHPYDDLPETKKNRIKAADFILKNGSKLFLTQLHQKLFFDKKKHRLLIQNMVESYSKKISPEALAAGMLAMEKRKNQSFLLEKTSVPIFQLIGKKDEAIPWDKNLEQTTLASRSKISLYQNIGHMGMYEAPDSTAQNIIDFIEYSRTHSL